MGLRTQNSAQEINQQVVSYILQNMGRIEKVAEGAFGDCGGKETMGLPQENYKYVPVRDG
jgi:hypothetical protein